MQEIADRYQLNEVIKANTASKGTNGYCVLLSRVQQKRIHYLYNSRQHAKSGSDHETLDKSKLRGVLQNDWSVVFEECQVHES